VEKPIYGSGPAVRLCLQTSDGSPINPLVAEEPALFDSRKALERLYEVIDVQRENLARLDSLLGCLVIAMEYGSEAERPPYFPDVAQMARELAQQSMRSLDPVAMPLRAPNKVKEGPRVYGAHPQPRARVAPAPDAVT
jgi:hypothetical protein